MGKQHISNSDHKIANNWDKFRLLMWKNALLQWRHKVQTIFEILVPIGFAGLLIWIRSLHPLLVKKTPVIYRPFEINTLKPLM